MSRITRLKKPDALRLIILAVAACFITDARASTDILGTAESFAILAASTVTNAGTSTIFGDLGLTPGTSVTGLAGSVVGSFHIADATAFQAQTDANNAFVYLSGLTVTQDLSGVDLGGLVLTPGVYRFSSSSQLTGTLVLDGLGQSNPLFVFQIGSTLTTATGSSFVAINGASASDTYFQVGSSATLGTGTSFAGNILAAASATVTTGSTVDGRIIAGAAITLDSNQISLASTSGTTWGFTKTGSYTLNLLKANSYSGVTTLNQGILQIGVDSSGTAGAITSGAFGRDQLVLQGGTLSSDGTAPRTILNAVTFEGDLSLGNATHTGKLTFGAAMDLGGGTRTLAVDSAVDFDGVLSNGGLNKAGSFELTLNGAGSYTGATTVSSGILTVNGSLDSGSTVTVADGATLKGNGVIGGSLSVSRGGVLAPGNDNGNRVLAIQGGTTLASGSIFEWHLDSALVSRGVAYNGLNTSSLSGTGAIFRIVLPGPVGFSDTFWDSSRTWTDIFKSADGTSALTNWASAFSGGIKYSYGGQDVAPSPEGNFILSGNSLSWSPVPEPTDALAGILMIAGFVVRRHRSGSAL